MKRFLLIVLLLAILAGVAGWCWYRAERSRYPTVKLSDGSRAEVVEVWVGEHRSPQLSPGVLERLSTVLPGSLGTLLPSSRVAPGGGSWRHVPDNTNTLRFWFSVPPWSAAANISGGQLAGRIRDEDGWVWESHARMGSSRQGWGTNVVAYLSLGFAGFPRWQEFLDIEVFGRSWSSQTGQTFGTIRLRNPAFGQPPEQWPVKPLPQTVAVHDLAVTLERLRFSPDRPRDEDAMRNGDLPHVSLRLHTVERFENRLLTNVWHDVQTSFYDNHGNNSHQGLPPLRPGDTHAPPIQWKVGVLLVGDEHSLAASNTFATLPPARLPADGVLWSPEAEQAELGDLELRWFAVMGAGRVEIVDGTMRTNYALELTPGRNPGLSSSSETTSVGRGKQRRTDKLTSAIPFVVVGVAGPSEGVWFSCRANDPEGDTNLWLQPHGSHLSSKPSFHRIYNAESFIAFTCSGLDTNRAWQFTVGAHAPRAVEFFLDRPKWGFEDASSDAR